MILSQYFSDYKEINALHAPGWVRIYENERLVKPAKAVLLQPAVQHVGVHRMLPGQACDGNAGLQASGHQFGFELCRVGAMGAG